MNPVAGARLTLMLLLVPACDKPADKAADDLSASARAPAPIERPEPVPVPEPKPRIYPKLPPIPAPSLPIADYLAAIPSEPPIYSEEVTGVEVSEGVRYHRCRDGQWNDPDCEAQFPKQGLLWARWACMHEPAKEKRPFACARLAEYIYRGIGGPKNPEFAKALFARECRSSKSGTEVCCLAASTTVFEDPELGLKYLGRVPAFNDNPGVCQHIMREVEAGLRPRKVVVDQVSGLENVEIGTECTLWIWADHHGAQPCAGHLDCKGQVIYGAPYNALFCDDDITATDPQTTMSDGDPSLKVDTTRLIVLDDETGALGAFELHARVVADAP